MKRTFPSGLPPDVARPLLQVGEQVRLLEPWKTMSDVHLIGLRDDASGDLHIGSILGSLGTLFAVVIYRNNAGRRWVYQIATSGEEPDRQESLESMDYLKLEWTKKNELRKPDLETLAAAEYKPKGKGHIWPRLESGEPGWFPWYPGLPEGRLLAEQLKKVLRFLRLKERVPDIYDGHPPGEVPIVPAGDEFSLQEEELNWLPLVLGPEPKPEPISFSSEEQERLAKLPMRKDFVFEFVAPLMPEIPYWDEAAGRPCLSRAGMLIDQHSHFIFATELAHGAAPLHKALKPVFVQGLLTSKVRPSVINVRNERLASVLLAPCESIGVSIAVADRLAAADDALQFLSERFRSQRRS